MSANNFFTVSCIIALFGWITLIFLSPRWTKWDKFVVCIVVVLLSLVYSYLNFTNFSMEDLKRFGSLSGISEIYQNNNLLMAGWAHFLAFDLLVACWIKGNSVKHGINHWVIVPSIILTCMLGPLGFLSYIVIRWIKTKDYFTDNSW